jgi:ribonuclease BN (tRNA processing enzyme)
MKVYRRHAQPGARGFSQPPRLSQAGFGDVAGGTERAAVHASCRISPRAAIAACRDGRWCISSALAVLYMASVVPLVAAAGICTGRGVEVQVLGSGGPELEDKRASSSYLVWQNGRPRILVDSGGGSALRFGQAGAHVAQLDVILFTHLHIDHSADFPALIKSSYFEERQLTLPVYGPSGNATFPSTTEFVADFFDRKRGAYRYLADFLAGNDGGYALQAHDVGLTAGEIRSVLSARDLELAATQVIHGGAPAIAWRVRLGGRTIVFSGDTNGENGNLERLAQGADLFVAHNAVPEGESGAAIQLHMPPSVIARIAKSAGVGQIVLSHRMQRTLGRESETRSAIARSYAGPVAFADDLDCFH